MRINLELSNSSILNPDHVRGRLESRPAHPPGELYSVKRGQHDKKEKVVSTIMFASLLTPERLNVRTHGGFELGVLKSILRSFLEEWERSKGVVSIAVMVEINSEPVFGTLSIDFDKEIGEFTYEITDGVSDAVATLSLLDRGNGAGHTEDSEARSG